MNGKCPVTGPINVFISIFFSISALNVSIFSDAARRCCYCYTNTHEIPLSIERSVAVGTTHFAGKERKSG